MLHPVLAVIHPSFLSLLFALSIQLAPPPLNSVSVFSFFINSPIHSCPFALSPFLAAFSQGFRSSFDCMSFFFSFFKGEIKESEFLCASERRGLLESEETEQSLERSDDRSRGEGTKRKIIITQKKGKRSRGNLTGILHNEAGSM